MPRFNPRDVREIIDMLEDGITSIRKLAKEEKIRMRGKISRQDGWISALSNPSAEIIYQRLGERLSDLCALYSYDFKEKLRRLLEEKSKRARSMWSLENTSKDLCIALKVSIGGEHGIIS